VATEAPEESGAEPPAQAFLEHVRKAAKPMLAAMVGNAFHAKRDGVHLSIFFDRGHANLIPMLKSTPHFKSLQDLAEVFFAKKVELAFAIGNDPKLKQQQKREAEILEIVKSDPKVKFVLDRFKGSIVSCQELDQPQE